MFHLALFDSSLAASTEAQITAVTDQILTIQDNGFLPQDGMELAFAYAMSADLQRAFLQSPTFRGITPPYIRPAHSSALLPTFGDVADWRANPLRVRGREVLQAWGFQDNAGVQDVRVGIGLQKSFQPAPVGDIMTMRGTSVTTATADQWTTLAMTWEDTLPEGRYAVVGLEAEGANMIGARLVLPDQQPRPGCPGLSAVGVQGPKMFRKGRLGLWGGFRSTDMPNPEVYCSGATAAFTLYMDIVRLSA